jgi:hypothetical protein
MSTSLHCTAAHPRTRYEEAAPLLETIFYIREKLVTISHVTVLECVVELVACLAAIQADDSAFRCVLIAAVVRTLAFNTIPYIGSRKNSRKRINSIQYTRSFYSWHFYYNQVLCTK